MSSLAWSKRCGRRNSTQSAGATSMALARVGSALSRTAARVAVPKVASASRFMSIEAKVVRYAKYGAPERVLRCVACAGRPESSAMPQCPAASCTMRTSGIVVGSWRRMEAVILISGVESDCVVQISERGGAGRTSGVADADCKPSPPTSAPGRRVPPGSWHDRPLIRSLWPLLRV